MPTRRIAYWAVTGLTAFVFLTEGVADLARPDFGDAVPQFLAGCGQGLPHRLGNFQFP